MTITHRCLVRLRDVLARRTLTLAVIAACGALAQEPASAADPTPASSCAPQGQPARFVRELSNCDAVGFDALFARSPAGHMPHGTWRGRYLRCPPCDQTALDPLLAAGVRSVWHGKTFVTDARGGHVYQNLEPLPGQLLPGDVGYAVYPADGRPALRIAYQGVTDWLREVRPGVYAGVVTLPRTEAEPLPVAHFLLFR
ncbi:hypothetical protein ACH4U6_33725 [Streptomyces netropsis]|uniref:hypothetical protein n=1 Tax=Streptomyces netropsis TaxID=55404 RepID=UPI0037AB4C6C